VGGVAKRSSMVRLVDPREFRRVLGHFATGVTVVTTRLGDDLHGITVNSFTSVSLHPPLVLICIDKSARAHDYLSKSGTFAVNILRRDQEHLSRFFADPSRPEGREGFRGIPFREAVTGSPILEGCLAFLDCRIVASYPGGDHTIFLGQVEDLGILQGGDPLVFYRSQYRSLGP